MIVLSERLLLIAEQIPQGSRLADIGSDHALLPAFLVKNGRVSFAVAGEVNPGPFKAAQRQVAEAGLKALIDVRRGDGLDVISPGEVDVITIAGMGGNLIVSILEAGKAKLAGVGRLVLQPNVGEEAVRRWLYAEGWSLIDEHILEEDGKIYEILTAERANVLDKELYKPRELNGYGVLTEERLFQFGPYLSADVSGVFVEKWTREIAKLERIAGQLTHSELDEAKRKREALLVEIAELKELNACLRKVKPLSK